MNTAAPARDRVLAQARFETGTLMRNGEQLLVALVLPAMALVGLATASPLARPGSTHRPGRSGECWRWP